MEAEHGRAVARGWGREEGVFRGASVSLWGEDGVLERAVVMAVPRRRT